MRNDFTRLLTKLILIIFQGLGVYFLMKLLGKKESTYLITFGIFLILSFTKNMYSFKSYLFWEELKRQLRLHVEVLGIFILIDVAQDKPFQLIIDLIGVGVFFIYNMILLRIVRKVFRGILEKNLLIIGVGNTAKYMAETVNNNSFTMYNLTGFLDPTKLRKRYTEKKSKEEEIKVDKDMILGDFNNLESIIASRDIDEVIIAVPDATTKGMRDIIEVLESKVKKIKFIPKLNTTFTFNTKVEDYDGMLLISSTTGEMTKTKMAIKRFIDILAGLAGLGILAILTPLIWFKTEKEERKNGLFFSQNRIGKNGESVKIYKYRSMVTNAEELLEKLMKEDSKVREEYLTNKKLKNDPRITKIGEKLRSTSLDEFPQFINVIKGNMSLIGPRPYLHRETGDMGEAYKSVVKMKPGITGMWQAHGRSDTTFDVRLELDKYYSRNWSLWLDIVILIKTFKQVLGREGGAY